MRIINWFKIKIFLFFDNFFYKHRKSQSPWASKTSVAKKFKLNLKLHVYTFVYKTASFFLQTTTFPLQNLKGSRDDMQSGANFDVLKRLDIIFL